MNPRNTVFDAKRLIGRKFADAEVQADMKHFPFTIVDRAGKPVIQVEYRGETKEFVSIALLLVLVIAVVLTLHQYRHPKKSPRWSCSR
jgi:L1 cell adhesion molecule like protein